jgi:hypothetical protein
VKKYFGTGQATAVSMALAHCMLDTLCYNQALGCVILIAIPRQQLLRERSSVLRYTDIASLLQLEYANLSYFKDFLNDNWIMAHEF